MKKLYLVLLCCLMAALTSFAQDDTQAPAFPGAEGHGRYTTGGRGGTVVHVTNLNDSGEGSFRAAVTGGNNRTIVFDVAGVIALSSDIKMKDNLTILGQTAPKPGITIRYYTVQPGANNIVRFIRFRRGQEKDINDGADATWQRNVTGLILDHCSFSWSIDEIASFYDNNNFTMQWCTVGESLTNPGHSKGAHGYGGIWGGKLASFHHNMIAHVMNRGPRFNGARYLWSGYTSNKEYSTYNWGNTIQAENVDFRNCVMYNAQGTCYGGPGGGQINIVNNYFKAGPSYGLRTTKDANGNSIDVNSSSSVRGNQDRITTISVANSGNATNSEVYTMTSRYYINGNTVQRYAANNSGAKTANRDWNGISYDSGVKDLNGEKYTPDPNNYYGSGVEHTTIDGVSCVKIKMTSPCPVGSVTTHTADNAFTKVLTYAGASLYRDNVDARYASEAQNGTATYKGSVTLSPGIIDKVSDVNGYTEANFGTGSRPSGFDTDGDGMPDEWETANGLNPNSNDANLYTIDNASKGGKGWYTNIEVYANSLVEDIMKNENKDALSSVNEYYPALAGGSSSTDPDPEIPTVTETIYSWESPRGSVQETGGTLTYTNGVSDPRVNVNMYNYYTIELMGKMANLSDATASENAGHMNIVLNSALKEGDIIKLTCFRRKDTDAGANAYLLFSNNTNTTIGGSDGLGFVNRYSDSSIVPNELTYTVSSENSGATSFKLTRGSKAGTTLFITKIEIVRSKESSSGSGTSDTEGGYTEQGNWIIVDAGSKNGFLNALTKVNTDNASSSASRKFIFLPNGTYDLGAVGMTKLSGHNVSIVGESENGVVIRSKMAVADEGLGKASTLWFSNTQHTYMQDFTIQNAMEYYTGSSAGRAACLQDEGKWTIAKNVKLLSYQDTYYSHKSGAYYYWEDSEIHGTVDFICGSGSAYFNRTKLYCESRETTANRGETTITAPGGGSTDKGYCFYDCTIDVNSATFNLGRCWKDQSSVVYINTTLMQPNKIVADWFTLKGMGENVTPAVFSTFGMKNASGNTVSPNSTTKTFSDKNGNNSISKSIVMSAGDATNYTLDKFFTDWQPDQIAAQKMMSAVTIDGTELKWTAVDGAEAYLIEKNGEFVAITTETTYEVNSSGTFTVRAANARGGFGEAVTAEKETVGVTSVIVSPANKTIEVGNTLQLSAQVLPVGAKQNVTWSSEYPNIATVDASGLVTAKATGTVNTVKITATATDGSGESDYCVLTVVDKQSGGGSGTLQIGGTAANLAGTLSSNNLIYTESNTVLGNVTLECHTTSKSIADADWTLENSKKKYFKLGTSANYTLKISDTTKKITKIEVFGKSNSSTKDGSVIMSSKEGSSMVVTNPSSTTLPMSQAATTLSYYISDWDSDNGINIYVGNQSVMCFKITYETPATTQTITKHISESTWASFVPEKSVVVPDDVDVYYVKSGSYNSADKTVTAVKILAGTVIKGDETNTYGYIVNAAEGNRDYQFEVSATEGQIFSENILACGKNEPIPNGSLVFACYNETSGFYALDNYAINLPVGIVYLPASVLGTTVGGAPKAVTINFDEATVINNPITKQFNNSFFNLSGQKVDANYKGIIIRNGRKYINK